MSASERKSASKSGAPDLESLAGDYWRAWSELAGAPGAAAAGHPWQRGIDWWTQLAHGGRDEVNAAVEQCSRQLRHWFGMMHEMAGRFAGQPAAAGEIAKAWREALGASGEQPFPELFKAFRGPGLKGLEQWLHDASPWLNGGREEIFGWLSLPGLGPGREHTERWERLAKAQIECQEQASRYQALLAKAGENAFARFEDKLAERSEPGRQIDSVRALFDLWIDAAEESYAEVALSPEFRSVYGALVNAQMRLRGALQTEMEQVARTLGLPTRSEVRAGHDKLHALERRVRELQARLASAEQARGPAVATSGRRSGGRKAVAKSPAKPPAKSPPKSAARRAPKHGLPPVAPPKSPRRAKPVRRPRAASRGGRRS